jgi:hypothetical protein
MKMQIANLDSLVAGGIDRMSYAELLYIAGDINWGFKEKAD